MSANAHRKALMRRLPDGLIVLAAAPPVVRNNDVEFRYRQDSSFLWLTGVGEPGYALLLDPRRGEEVLFCPRPSQQHAVWLGHIPSLAEARRRFGVADVADVSGLERAIAKRVRGHGPVYADARATKRVRRASRRARIERASLEDALQELRVIKDAGEVALLERANTATAAGHLAAMRLARPGLREFQIQAELERHFRFQGGDDLGYNSIVAAGANSAVLHYTRNDDLLRRGELMLIDAGAECGGYAADVTRCFPISGRFSARQRDVYEVVLAAQEACIDFARPGVTSMDWQRLAERKLAEGLRSLGLLRGSTDELVETEAIRVFFPHGIGHTLGLDVHDVRGGRKRQLRASRTGRLRFRARLEPGFVITVEPGVYFIAALIQDPKLRAKHRRRVNFALAERYLGFGGVRIEDDVVVRAGGPPRNLTRVPKRVRDVEGACAA